MEVRDAKRLTERFMGHVINTHIVNIDNLINEVAREGEYEFVYDTALPCNIAYPVINHFENNGYEVKTVPLISGFPIDKKYIIISWE